jgi:hypothetical protein
MLAIEWKCFWDSIQPVVSPVLALSAVELVNSVYLSQLGLRLTSFSRFAYTDREHRGPRHERKLLRPSQRVRRRNVPRAPRRSERLQRVAPAPLLVAELCKHPGNCASSRWSYGDHRPWRHSRTILNRDAQLPEPGNFHCMVDGPFRSFAALRYDRFVIRKEIMDKAVIISCQLFNRIWISTDTWIAMFG